MVWKTILSIIIPIVIGMGGFYIVWADSEYDKELREKEQAIELIKYVKSLKVVRCKTCGAPVRITQKCPYCGNQN